MAKVKIPVPNAKKLGENLKGITSMAKDAAGNAKDLAQKSQGAVLSALDQNGDGQIDIEDIIVLGMRVPGIKVNRDAFLRKEFMKNYPESVVEDAIRYTPAHAQIPCEAIDKIADEVIQFERVCVSAISAALCSTGGVTILATLPTDIAQYYGYMLRAAQKLLYLYGFPEIDTTEKDGALDTETVNILILCLGVMHGAAGANAAIKTLAKGLANGVEKQLLRTALTKGTIYPIVKSVSKLFGARMTKEIFAGSIKHAIPVVGGVIGGGLTYASFKPCCVKLKKSLQNTLLSNPNYRESDDIIILDADGVEIV